MVHKYGPDHDLAKSYQIFAIEYDRASYIVKSIKNLTMKEKWSGVGYNKKNNVKIILLGEQLPGDFFD